MARFPLRRTVVLAALALAAPGNAGAQDGWSIELAGGFALNGPTRLTIHQAGQPDLRIAARYASRSFATPIYYALRVGRWVRGRAWEVEFVHHKVYLSNPPPDVQQFDVSHGFNLITVNRALPLGRAVWRPGFGLVLAHPESMVRGRPFDTGGGLLGWGYYVAGPAVQLAVARRFSVANRFFVSTEGKLTAAYARVPVNDGSARMTNLALHGLLGLGWGP